MTQSQLISGLATRVAQEVNTLRDDLEMRYALKVDTVSESLIYVGFSAPSTLDNAAGWRIKRVTISGDDVVVAWADGNINFDNIWNNRDSLGYS